LSAPQNYWIDGSAAAELFHDAEPELASLNGDAMLLTLHVIVIDEIDAVFRKRSSAENSKEATQSSTVNQVLES
jgi:vesicle-fusing ATPase